MSGFRCGIAEDTVVEGYGAASMGNRFPSDAASYPRRTVSSDINLNFTEFDQSRFLVSCYLLKRK